MPNASPFRPAALLAAASLAVGALLAAPAWAQEASSPGTAPAAAPAVPVPDPAAVPPGVSPGVPMADPVATATLPHDLSPWGMFMAASPVVQAVMIGLVLASIATWTVFLAKSMELASAKRKARAALAALDQARSLTQAADTVGFDTGPAGSMLRATFAEVHQSADAPSLDGLKERTESRLQRIEAAEGRRMMRGTGILASIGSTAPFVGLFGTVWGIMTSFIGIAKTQTTNLAVVAPGIAEALLATAIGLVAAIPAVVIYNAFSRSIGGYRAQLGDASAAVQRLLSRDIDRHALPRASAAAE